MSSKNCGRYCRASSRSFWWSSFYECCFCEISCRFDSCGFVVYSRNARSTNKIIKWWLANGKKKCSSLLFSQYLIGLLLMCISSGADFYWEIILLLLTHKQRLALARALFTKPDVLLLDEPTNHLDLHAVIWLEEELQTWPSTLVVVSHDSNFLNEVVTDVIELRNQQLTSYRGNWETFVQVRRPWLLMGCDVFLKCWHFFCFFSIHHLFFFF